MSEIKSVGRGNNLTTNLDNLKTVSEQVRSYIQTNRPAALPQTFFEKIYQAHSLIEKINLQVQELEEERRSLTALAGVGQVINSSLNLSIVLQIVMDTIIRITGAERGFLMLRDEQGNLVTHIARNWVQESLNTTELQISFTVIDRVANEGQPVLTTNAQEDPRFGNQDSVIAHNLRSILCVPLRVKNEVTGVIYADNRIRSGLFTARQLDLLAAFANQAAVAIENARLFDSVKQTLSEVTELKSLMDNVFESIASGVLTADIQERILLCNRAAEQILHKNSRQLIGERLETVLDPLSPALLPELKRVLDTDEPMLGLEISPIVPRRGQIDLRLSITPLKDDQDRTQGVAIVMDDLTEKKQLEAQRRLFEKMVSPAVIRQLNPDSLILGGQRKEITILFADIRGFTMFSESSSPEELVAVLNRHLAAAAEAVLQEGGTIDKFLGDAIMAWFNAPVRQPDHALRAVRAALNIRKAMEELHRQMPPEHHLTFGMGIHTGEAVLGLVGSDKRMEYTAIGDCINTTKRIQENASGGQILITQAVIDRLDGRGVYLPTQAIHAKGKRDPIQVFELSVIL
ncbi:MAG: adenylate/guanylate cyclase domain-containing protein [Chloroflexota bacterium]